MAEAANASLYSLCPAGLHAPTCQVLPAGMEHMPMARLVHAGVPNCWCLLGIGPYTWSHTESKSGLMIAGKVGCSAGS